MYFCSSYLVHTHMRTHTQEGGISRMPIGLEGFSHDKPDPQRNEWMW